MEGNKMSVELIETHRSFGGEMRKYRHFSKAMNVDMIFSLFVPEVAEGKELSLIWWLSGLTCTDDNFSQKSGFQQYAAKHEVAFVMPDTSPRGEKVADSDEWDLGTGASFYVNATEAPWSEHYQMYTYLTEELPQVVYDLLGNYSGKESIMGHSMGGHGALIMGLKNPQRFKAISAFAPISNPTQVPWGKKAFSAYLGSDEATWQEWDATYLMQAAKSSAPILITQGDADNFYEVQLQEKAFLEAAAGHEVEYHLEKGYDHSYFTISTFIGEHIQFHVEALNK